MYQAVKNPQLRLLEEDDADDPTIKGYVIDNMEGAVDQATFLAGTDIPVAVVGARGTGKMYIARVVHQESNGGEGQLVPIDCREFRNREEAVARIRRELERSAGSTLVFKSPQLMNPDAQNRLARQLSSRVLADSSPPRYLPRAKYVALFPDSIENLLDQGNLTPRLASVFAGYPINVPPIRDRKQAVLRWAHKILGQECEDRHRSVKGFSPDAEEAMLAYEWPGNITEMRQRIVAALDGSEREWLTPVDLGIYRAEDEDAAPSSADLHSFLGEMEEPAAASESYAPSALEALDIALGEAVNRAVAEGEDMPLGAWLSDEVVLAVSERYRQDAPAAARFLHTRSRNISRWMPRIEERTRERAAESAWREPQRLVGEWIREIPPPDRPPLESVEELLFRHLETLGQEASVKTRAAIAGVSVPTYQKRLKSKGD